MYPRKRALERIARERVLYARQPGGDISVCVIYPNTYRLGMANLGFQAVFHIFESDTSVAADRAFLPDEDERDSFREGGERLVSFERGRPLSDFDILAFSISFETDYLNVLSVLRMAGIPARRADRAGRNFPLIIAGGSAVFLNPEPIADFIDLFLIGEGEEMVPEFIERWDATRGIAESTARTRIGCGRISARLLRARLRRRRPPRDGEIRRSGQRSGESPPDSRPQSLHHLVADSH